MRWNLKILRCRGDGSLADAASNCASRFRNRLPSAMISPILCLWFPRWPLEPPAGRSAGPAGAPHPALRANAAKKLADRRSHGSRRTARHAAGRSPCVRSECGVRSAECGVKETRNSGFQNSALRTPHSALHIECHDPWADRQALVALAEACRRYSPLVGIEDCAAADVPVPEPAGSAECGMQNAECRMRNCLHSPSEPP